MKWLLRAAAPAVLVLAIAVGASAAPPTALLPAPATVATWPGGGSFAESMTLGSDGYLYVSRTIWGDTGVVERIEGPAWQKEIEVGEGLLTGVATGPDGRLYVGIASFGDAPATGVLRIEANGGLTQVVTLPAGAFPNGLAFSGDVLYVTDPDHGTIYRVPVAGMPATPEPWLQDRALTPTKALGVNGIAFRNGRMYLAQYDRGQILEASLAGGAVGPLEVLAQDPELKTADGIAFDPLGNLWVAVNGTGPSKSGRLVVVSPHGEVVSAAAGVPWLDYPTQPVFAPGGLFVVNGSFGLGSPSVVGWRF